MLQILTFLRANYYNNKRWPSRRLATGKFRETRCDYTKPDNLRRTTRYIIRILLDY